jgi:caffeoyl-CoA O-methyltransferase
MLQDVRTGPLGWLTMTDLVTPAAAAYAAENTTPFDDAVGAITGRTRDRQPNPEMMSGLAEARLLEALLVVSGARRVLEIGTFTGVGAVSMAAALPPGGQVTTLEVNPDTAATAQRNIDESGYGDRIELIVGDALQTLERLKGPFDLVYIDAWKSDYPAYYDRVVPKLAERGLIVADNVLQSGRAFDPEADDDGARGVRAFARRANDDPRVHNVLLTIGDGVMMIWRHSDAGQA